mmetsp:Transcript_43593/g.78234  ORF Transcript_43593/g.78234 Transcript_43593/m.78234 type:complete len:230 (-) Transcript_43593:237-926(-)
MLLRRRSLPLPPHLPSPPTHSSAIIVAHHHPPSPTAPPYLTTPPSPPPPQPPPHPTMAPKSPKRPQQLTRYYHILLPSILVAIFFSTGSAFIPLPIHVASAAMSTDNSYSGAGSNSKPLSAEGGATDNNENSQPSQDGVEGTLPLLQASDSNDASIRSIKLGESISFEEMGPIIINADGTTRSIDNWDQMTQKEQEVAWRRISKRNEARRKVLLEQQQEEMEGKTEEQQ